MRRSMLFIPGNTPSLIMNGEILGADSIILDLEDAVSPAEKDSARILVRNTLKHLGLKGCEIVIRINPVDTDFWYKDLDEIVPHKPDAIMLPKARISYLKELDELLTDLEQRKKLTKKIKILPIIELAISVLEVDIIASLPRVDGILLGAEDLSSDLEVERTKEGKEIEYARSKVAFACKAYQIDAIDTPFTDVNDPVGLRIDAQNAQTFAMNAKSAIHPNQIDTINDVFLPAPKLINWAKRVKAASDDALFLHLWSGAPFRCGSQPRLAA